MVCFRICFFGDSITAGTGDVEFLGWPGRLSALAAADGHDLSSYNLGVRAETSRDIRARWQAEASPRLPPHVEGRLVFSFGVNDVAHYNDEGQRISRAESLDNAAAILSAAKETAPCLWIGPTPVRRGGVKIEPGPGVVFDFDRGRTEALSQSFAELADRLDIPFLDVFSPLDRDPDWDRAMAEGDGVHPTADGYARFARLIAQWDAWRAWLNS